MDIFCWSMRCFLVASWPSARRDQAQWLGTDKPRTGRGRKEAPRVAVPGYFFFFVSTPPSSRAFWSPSPSLPLPTKKLSMRNFFLGGTILCAGFGVQPESRGLGFRVWGSRFRFLGGVRCAKQNVQRNRHEIEVKKIRF